MLSVRSLKKIAQSKKTASPARRPSLDSPPLSPGGKTSPAATANGTSTSLASTSPTATSPGTTQSLAGAKRKRLRFGGVEEVGAPAASKVKCPSPQEIREAVVNMLNEAHRQSVHHLVLGLATLLVAGYVLSAMINYLVAILDVDLPSGSSVATTFTS